MCELKETVYIRQEWTYFIILVSLLPRFRLFSHVCWNLTFGIQYELCWINDSSKRESHSSHACSFWPNREDVFLVPCIELIDCISFFFVFPSYPPQLLLDTHSLKTMLLDLPSIGSKVQRKPPAR